MMFCVFFVACMAYQIHIILGAPKAPALSNSKWPIAHADTWNTDSSENTGPSAKTSAVQFLLSTNIGSIYDIFTAADPITLVQSEKAGYTWGSSISSVFQLQTTENGISLLNSLFRDMNFEYHGAYCLLSRDGTYYAATKTSIQAYNNEIPFDFSTPIVKVGEYFITGFDDSEHIIGLTISHDQFDDAFLIFASTKGTVGGVSLDFKTSSNFVAIPGVESVEKPDHFVSNSIAMDGPSGGIYVCTSLSMNRLQWDSTSKSISLDWSTKYSDGYDEWFWGRLGPGSGTSPTIVGPNDVPEFAVITDGESPINILFYDVKTGKLAGSHVVTFGARGKDVNSTTEQSIVVKDYKVVVVNNWIADSVNKFCSEWFVKLPVSEALQRECPFVFGAYANGVEQFEIDPKTGVVKSVWANSQVSCSSSIPVVSSTTDTLYCLGKRRQIKARDIYTIEAVDWTTGRSKFYVELSASLMVNSLYAATEIGTNGDVVIGTLAGVVRVSDPAAGVDAAGSASSAMATATASLGQNAVAAKAWGSFERLAELFAMGEVPSAEEMAEMGL